MFSLHHISYQHPDRELLFEQLDLSISTTEKIAMVGNNGTGKSTLLKIIAGEIEPTTGVLNLLSRPYYVPQILGQYNELTINQALKVDQKVKALNSILEGEASEENFMLLADDWTIEERCLIELSNWGLDHFNLNTKLTELSGGQKTKVFLAGIAIHKPKLVLLDEPSNHLDKAGRRTLYELIEKAQTAMIIVSHDRKLLNLMNKTYELDRNGLKAYGGNYDFYVQKKRAVHETLNQDWENKQKELRKAKAVERESIERQQKLDAKGKKKQQQAGVSRIMLNTLRNKAENSTAKTKEVHSERVAGLFEELRELRSALIDSGQLQVAIPKSKLHHGKVLFRAEGVSHCYNNKKVWIDKLDFLMVSGERVCLAGLNGSGKTTLIKLLLGKLEPTQGNVLRTPISAIYIDQEYSLIDDLLTVYNQARQFNTKLLEHEIKIRLDRYLFGKEQWNKSCASLSGGEKMRLLLCCLTIGELAPELIILDEPTNNLDLQSLAVLTTAIANYDGTLIVVSHDEQFVREVGCNRTLTLLGSSLSDHQDSHNLNLY